MIEDLPESTREPAGSYIGQPARTNGFVALLIFAIGLPIVVVVVNKFALAVGEYGRWETDVLLPVFVFYIIEVAMIGYVLGVAWRESMWKWVVFVWTMVLIDLQMFIAIAQTQRYNGRWYPERDMPYALFAGQLGMLTIWGVLGGTRLERRLPIVVVATGLTTYVGFSGTGFSGESSMNLLVQCIATIVLCGLMWLRGFRVELMSPQGDARRLRPGELSQAKARQVTSAVLRSTIPQGRRMQFSLWHVFVWISALAPILAVARLLDWATLQHSGAMRIVDCVGTGVSLAIVSLIAMWAALGRESVAVRMGVLVVFIPVIGSLFGAVQGLTAWMEYGFQRGMRSATLLDRFGDRISFWITWTVLSSFFLSGMLMIFRGSGYGLFRRAPQ